MTGLQLSDFAVRRSGREIVARTDLALPAKGIVGVIGPNGAGKSTVLQAIAGVLPHRGRVTLDGRALSPETVGFLPQNFAVASALTVEEVVLLGRRERLGWRVAEVDRLAALSALNDLGLTDLAPRRMDSLSGGQQQLVLLAQRLSRNPRLLVLDEPTSALDLHHQLEVLTHLRHHADGAGTLVLVALHDLSLAGRFADEILLVAGGAILAQGPAEHVMRNGGLDRVYGIETEVLSSRDAHLVIVPHLVGSGVE